MNANLNIFDDLLSIFDNILVFFSPLWDILQYFNYYKYPIFVLSFVFIVGLCISSFINVFVLRYKKIEDYNISNGVKNWLEEKGHPQSWPSQLDPLLEPISYNYPRSHCYHCKNQLKWWHNIPVLSYIILKGRCGFCKTPFSSKYAITELVGAFFSLTAFYIGITINPFFSILLFVLSLIYFAAILVDYSYFEIPDCITFSSIAIVAAFTYFFPFTSGQFNLSFGYSLFSGFVAFSFFWLLTFISEKILNKPALGFGDTKLIFSLSMIVGLFYLPTLITIAAFLGLFHFLIIKVKKSNNPQIPFGPSLIFSFFITIFIMSILH